MDAAQGKKTTSGETYGLFQEYVIAVLRSSPYWNTSNLEEKFEFPLGGWANQVYRLNAASVSPSSRYLTIGAYNGGWDEEEPPPTTQF